MILLYIDALTFNFGANVLNKSGQYLLNYYVATDDSLVDKLENVDNKVISDEVAFALNVTSDKSKSRDFSVKVEDQQFIKRYKLFDDSLVDKLINVDDKVVSDELALS